MVMGKTIHAFPLLFQYAHDKLGKRTDAVVDDLRNPACSSRVFVKDSMNGSLEILSGLGRPANLHQGLKSFSIRLPTSSCAMCSPRSREANPFSTASYPQFRFFD